MAISRSHWVACDLDRHGSTEAFPLERLLFRAHCLSFSVATTTSGEMQTYRRSDFCQERLFEEYRLEGADTSHRAGWCS